MITTINGRKAIIRFAHKEDTTGCALFDAETKDNLSFVMVRRHKNDQPNRVKARKAALAKALKPFTREQRTVVWTDVAKQMRIK